MNEEFFENWINSYPESIRSEFHRDGILDDALFAKENVRILFVTKEPNSKKGNYNKYLGKDLRKVWTEDRLKKRFDYNIGRWAKIICDGIDPGYSLSWDNVAQTMRRVAIVNLKKMAGSGSENREEVSLCSFKDREFIKAQILEIQPNVILACGKDGFVFRMLWRIMHDAVCFPERIEDPFYLPGQAIPVFSVYHPSCRKPEENKAAARIKEVRKQFENWSAHKLRGQSS